MTSKERLCWAVAGGVLLGIIIGLCISPLTAQDGNFDSITCRSLNVVDKHGSPRVSLTGITSGGVVGVFGRDGLSPRVTLLGVSGDGGGVVAVFDGEGNRAVALETDEDGGAVSVADKSGKDRLLD